MVKNRKPFFAPQVLCFVCVVFASFNIAAGQDDQKQPEKGSGETEQAKEKAEPVPDQYDSPRSTLTTFLDAVRDEDYELAFSCLDFESLEFESNSYKRKSLCDKLYVLLHDAWHVDPEASPSVDIGQPFSLEPVIGIVNSPDAAEAAARIKIAKSESGWWKFTAESIEAVDEELYDKWVGQTDVARSTDLKMSFPMWLESKIPVTLKKKSFLIKDYQWIALLVVLFAGFAIDRIVRAILNLLTNLIFRNELAKSKADVRRNLWRPVGLLLNALTWYFGASLIDLPANFLSVLSVGLKLFGVFAFIWTAFTFINFLSDYLLRKAKRDSSRYEYLLVPFIKNGLKILAVCIGLVVFVDVFALNWNSLLGGFGLGGIAIAIASKDVLGNVFGSLTVLTDRPFEIGDWVITEGVEGEVESVGMRSSRIRTFYNSIVVVPNSRLTTAIVDNMGRREFRRVKTMIGVEYATSPDQMEAFCEGIRELIRQNAKTRKDYFHVYVNEFGPSAVNILVYFFLKTPDWSGELFEKHKIMINILKLAKELEVHLAFPTQTLHVQQDEPRGQGMLEIEAPRDLGKDTAANISQTK